MADQTLAQLPASSGVAAADLLYLVSGGADYRATAAQVAAYVAGTLAGTGGGTYSAANKDAQTIAAGAPVATHASGTGVIAASAADATRPAVGLLPAAVAVGFAGTVQTTGPVTLADWTAVTGTATLAARATYFLDPANPGRLTTTPPTGSGQVLQAVGAAVATTTLDIQIAEPILL